MTPHEPRFVACWVPRAPFMQCAKPAGHDGFHETKAGTEFTNSGKVGLGKVGSDYNPVRCHCTHEAGDSACPLHGEEEH